jgi:hypothetical protein
MEFVEVYGSNCKTQFYKCPAEESHSRLLVTRQRNGSLREDLMDADSIVNGPLRGIMTYGRMIILDLASNL